MEWGGWGGLGLEWVENWVEWGTVGRGGVGRGWDGVWVGCSGGEGGVVVVVTVSCVCARVRCVVVCVCVCVVEWPHQRAIFVTLQQLTNRGVEFIRVGHLLCSRLWEVCSV